MLTDEQKAELKNILDAAVVERVEAEMKKVIPKFNPGIGAILGVGAGDNPAGKFKSFGDFLRTTKFNPHDARLKAVSEGIDSGGGFLVPEEFRADLFRQELEESIVRPYATVVPMASDTLNWPAISATSNVSHRFGGVLGYSTEEAGSKTASEPKFRQIKLIAKKRTAYTIVSDELLADSAIALVPVLQELYREDISWEEDYAYLRGTGVGEELGIFNSGAVVLPTRAVASQVSLADIANIIARMWPPSLYRPSTIWICSPAVLAQLIPLVATVITWLPSSGGIAARIPATILGMPLRISEKVPTLGTTGDIGLYDLSYYVIGDRSGLQINSSEHVRFTTDETVWRFVKRGDGQPKVDSAFTPKNAGATLSPFVQLSSATA